MPKRLQYRERAENVKSEPAEPGLGWQRSPYNLRAEMVILRLYLSNFTSEHTAELGLGQGIRMLGWLGKKSKFCGNKNQIPK